MKLMKLMKLPSVAIIILNWNGLKDTLECLESVLKNTYPNYFLVIIDNASTNNELLAIQHFLQTHNLQPNSYNLIQSPTNLGFAEGNNVGIRKAMELGAEYIFTLNNDTIVDPNFLTEAVLSFRPPCVTPSELRDSQMRMSRGIPFPKTPPSDSSTRLPFDRLRANSVGMTTRDEGAYRIGIVATTMLNYYDHKLIDSLGHDLLTTGDTIPRDRGLLVHSLQPTTYNLQPVLGACAGAALYSVEMLRQIGLFDADFFLNYEDADLSLRALVQGWRIGYCSTSIIYHKGSASIGKIKDTAYRVRSQRNMLWAYFNNIPLLVMILNIPWLIIRDFFAILLSALAFQWTITKILVLSRWQVLRSLRTILKKRRSVLGHQRVSSFWLWWNQRSWIPVYFRYFLRQRSLSHKSRGLKHTFERAHIDPLTRNF